MAVQALHGALLQPIQNRNAKKKLTIFISKGGACHLIACGALQKYLANDYDITVVNPIEELLHQIDPVTTLTCGCLDGENLYNKTLQNGWIRPANYFIKKQILPLISKKNEIIEEAVTRYIAREKPDLLISIIPFFNLAFASAAERCCIPFLLITLDSDLTTWMLGMDKIIHPNYEITIGSDLQITQAQLHYSKIPPEHVHNIGYPMRESFLLPHNKEAIREAWNIPNDKFIIMLLMGGAGSNTIYDYAQRIAAMPINAHLLVCTGRNTAIAEEIEKLKLADGISTTIIGQTDYIAELMSVADLLITKTGPGSINEAIQMQLPMLLDGTNTVLFWEQPNMTLVEQHGWGEVVHELKDLERLIHRCIYDKNYYNGFKERLAQPRNYNFFQKLKELIEMLFHKQDKIFFHVPSLTE